MKRFAIPFSITLVFHIGLLFADFAYFKKEKKEKPKIQFMTMTTAHVESPKPVKKPEKKIVRKKKKPKKKRKEKLKKKPVEKKKALPEKKIQPEKEKEPETPEEPKEKVEDSKGAVARIQKASPLYRHNPTPKYPRSARKRGWQGVVELEVVVDKEGNVRSVKVFKSSGFSILDRAAVKTVKRWRFSPGTKGGKAIETEVIVPVKFSLTG